MNDQVHISKQTMPRRRMYCDVLKIFDKHVVVIVPWESEGEGCVDYIIVKVQISHQSNGNLEPSVKHRAAAELLQGQGTDGSKVPF